jgi:PqqD family protein of HPr-rel-A system
LVTTVWTCTPPGRFLFREWDGECVVFDLLSNDTHACDALTTAAMHELQAGPSMLPHLTDVIAASLGWGCDAEFTVMTNAALENLERLGIVERMIP